MRFKISTFNVTLTTANHFVENFDQSFAPFQTQKFLKNSRQKFTFFPQILYYLFVLLDDDFPVLKIRKNEQNTRKYFYLTYRKKNFIAVAKQNKKNTILVVFFKFYFRVFKKFGYYS